MMMPSIVNVVFSQMPNKTYKYLLSTYKEIIPFLTICRQSLTWQRILFCQLFSQQWLSFFYKPLKRLQCHLEYISILYVRFLFSLLKIVSIVYQHFLSILSNNRCHRFYGLFRWLLSRLRSGRDGT